MSRLSEILPFNDGETVASFASRLAAVCGYRHARSFGFDLGFRFQGLAVGDEADLHKFADILDTNVASLSRGMVATDGRMSMVAGQQLSRAVMQRQRLRFCPFCVRDDEHRYDGRRGFRAFGRLEWLVTSIRTCSHHGVQLATSENDPAPTFLHDFAANLTAESENMDRLMADAHPLEVDSLQRYVEARLRAMETGSAWLDSLPLYVAIRMCEIVGASERHGIQFNTAMIDERDWSACAGTGYDILSGGENDFRVYLRGHLDRFLNRRGDMGGRSLFGRLYERLAHETSDTAYDPVREIMRDVALSNLPLGPGDNLFGPVTERRLHSVQSASKEFGIHPNRLRKLLVNTGLVPKEARTTAFERILLDAETMEKFATEAGRSLDVPEAKAHLGAGRVQFELLVKHGFIRPHAGDRSDSTIAVDRRFFPSDLDDLLGRLQSAVTCLEDEGMSDMQEAVRKAGCTFAEVLDLILQGSLAKVAWAADYRGIAAIRVDVQEVKERTTGEDHGCLSLRDVEKRIPASNKIVKALVEGRQLKTVKRRNPVKRNMQTVVEPADLVAFIQEFASLGNLATSRRTRTWILKRQLDAAGIQPVFEVAEMPFYRRSVAEAL